MIISRTPLRIEIGGGGTDLPSFYSRYGSYFISSAINKYIYVVVNDRKYQGNFVTKYFQVLETKTANQIKDDLTRACLKFLRIDQPLEIISFSDLPSQSGSGSSGAFCVGFLNALHAFKKEPVSPAKLAQEACHINIDILGSPAGKQDEYAAAIGGLTDFSISRRGKVKIACNRFDTGFIREIEQNLYLFDTEIRRPANKTLNIQRKLNLKKDKGMIGNFKEAEKICLKMKDAIIKKDGLSLGKLLDEHWQVKRIRPDKPTTPQIDKWYGLGLKMGAIGGTLIGAGRGGFLLFYCPEKPNILISSLEKAGLIYVPTQFDYQGTTIVYSS
ncbi:MAG: galactokinase [Candidatus Woesebacteria bacterium]|nr:galactokinase [Candidatus Woesebacteria bacterium]